jgi:phosphate transport system permease protein
MTGTLNAPAMASAPARPRLPWWSFAVIGATAVVLTLAAFAATPMQGRVEFLLVATVLHVVAQTAVSWIVEGRRRAADRLATSVLVICTVAAVALLVAVLGFTIVKGVRVLNTYFLTRSMRGVAEEDVDGGIHHAIIGTLEQVGLATLMAVPFGIFVAIYLVEYSSGRFGRLVDFFVDVMTGLPSIVAGLFVLALWMLALHQSFPGFAGSLALTILMIPTVVRTTEEMLKTVPDSLREGSCALGVHKWVTVVRIVLPTDHARDRPRHGRDRSPAGDRVRQHRHQRQPVLPTSGGVAALHLLRGGSAERHRHRPRVGGGTRAHRHHPAAEHQRADHRALRRCPPLTT